MKVLKSQLKRIIKEEVGKLQQEMQHGSSAHVTVENIGRDSVELRVSLSLTDGVADTSDLVPAVERAIEFGKDPKISQENKKKGSDMKIRLQEKETFRRIQKEQMAKIIEDILVNKKNKKDIVDKKKGREVFTKSEIIDLIKKNEPIDNIDKVIKSSREQ